MLESRAKDNGGKLKVVDINKVESELKVNDLTTLGKIIEDLKNKYPGFRHHRIPICNSAAPNEADLDEICKCLIGTNVNTPVIINCQV